MDIDAMLQNLRDVVLIAMRAQFETYRVGEDLYVQAHDGTDYYHFVVPYHFAGVL